MGFFEAVFLGVVQGLTEFLPVSSSGHLVIMQHLLGVRDSGLVFEVLLHCGTLAAVIVVFYHDIVGLLKKPFQKYTWLLLVGTIPTGIIGVLFKDTFETLFSSVLVVGLMLIVTGTILYAAEKISRKTEGTGALGTGCAFAVGVAQGLAITPGISRSGITIAIGLFSGLSRETAARFSFLLSIPAILGATALEGMEFLKSPQFSSHLLIPYAAGTLAAAISGYAAIKILLRLLQERKLSYFAAYCWLVGLLAIVLYF